VSSIYPAAGASMRTFLLALIAINQVVGPILFRRALVAAGELPDRTPADGGAAVGTPVAGH